MQKIRILFNHGHNMGCNANKKKMGSKKYIIRNNAHESSDCWMSIQRLSCFFNLCFSCSSRSNKRRRDCLLPPPAAGYAAAQASPPHRTPIAGLAIPLLTHTCCYSPATADEESFHSVGRENGLSVMRNGLYIFKTHQTGN